MTKTNAEIFQDAKEIIEKRGLKKGRFGERDGPVCMAGAINEALNGAPCAFAGTFPFYEILLSILCEDGGILSGINDQPDFTKEHAVWALEQARLSVL